MADIVDSLFGPTPWQIQQAQNAGLAQAADKYASQDPFQRAAGGMYRAGGMLAQPIAESVGMVNPAIEQSKLRQQVMNQGGDLSTSAGLKAKAAQFAAAGDQQTAMKLVMAAKAQEAKEQESLINQRKQILAERKQEFQEQDAMDLKRQQLQQAYTLAKERAEDKRNSDADRVAAMREATAARLELGRLMIAMKQSSGITPPKNLTREARLKWELDNGLIDQATFDMAMAGTPGGKAKVESEKEQKAAIGFLKEAGYDPETGKDEISQLIPKSTSGRLESLGAETAAFFGASTEGRKALNTLAAKSNKIVMAMMGGKLGAGVSNADREFIVGQLGEVANSNKPAEERLAAWTAVKNRMIEVGMVPSPNKPQQPSKTVNFGDLQ